MIIRVSRRKMKGAICITPNHKWDITLSVDIKANGGISLTNFSEKPLWYKQGR